MMIVCGVNFPLEALPPWLGTAARFLPMTNGLLAVRTIVDGSTYPDVLPLIGAEALAAAAFGAIGYVVFVWQLNQARKDGKIELF